MKQLPETQVPILLKQTLQNGVTDSILEQVC